MSVSNVVENSAKRCGFCSWLHQELRENALVYAILLAFLSAVLALSVAQGASLLPHLMEYGTRILRALLLLGSSYIVAACVKALVSGRNGSPVAIVIASLRGALNSARAIRYLYACVILAVFMAAFLYCKMQIPVINPFSWDVTFAEWDRMIFGDDPWRLLQPFLAMPPITLFFDLVYSSWVPAVFLFWAGLLGSPRVPAGLRTQYWLATVSSWLLIGLVLATLFSSAGPCYFEHFVRDLPSPYAGLNSYLDDVDASYGLSSARAKALLWDVYTGGSNLPGGISAMPSMHNAQCVLFVAVAYRLNRWFGHAMAAYGAAIFVGSIHLGWHYAVDGIVAIACALLLWRLAGLAIGYRGGRAHAPQPGGKVWPIDEPA